MRELLIMKESKLSSWLPVLQVLTCVIGGSKLMHFYHDIAADYYGHRDRIGELITIRTMIKAHPSRLL